MIVAGDRSSGGRIANAGASTRSGPAPLWRWGDPFAALAERLARGGMLAIPTESSYGLAVDPRNPEAVARVYGVKGRDAGKPLPVVAAGVEQLALLGIDREDRDVATALEHLARIWPAPLTAVLPVTRPLPASAGAGTLAVRVPAHEGLRRLLGELGTPLTATSANPAGEAPVLDPLTVADLLAGEDAAVVDGGRLPGGPPSTLVVWRPGPGGAGRFEVLRAGAFPLQRLGDPEPIGEPEGRAHRIR